MLKLTRFLKPYRLQVLSVMVLVFAQSLSELMLPTIMADIVDKGVINGDTKYIMKLGMLMVAIAIGGTIASVFASYLSAKTGAGFSRDLRTTVFEKATRFSLDEFEEFGTSSLITRTTNDIKQVQTVLTNMLRISFRAPLLAIGGIIMAFSKDPGLSQLLIYVVFILITVIVLIARKSIPLFKQMQNKLDNLNLVLRERLMGIRVIRAFNKSQKEQIRFEESNFDLTDTSLKVKRLMALLMPLMMLILNMTTIGIIWFGSKRIELGALQVGDMMAFIQYAMQILFALIMLTMIFISVPRAAVSSVRINEVLDKEGRSTESAEDEFEIEIPTLEFRNVCYKYKNAEECAIKDISFITKPGELTAIIGSTGSGKSTLINLIPRLYEASKGEILIGGMNIKDMKLEKLRKKISYVSQKPLLFSGSIMDNIKFEDNNITDELAIDSAKVAQATEFIDKLENGYDNKVDQGGTNLSGGQKQRISIARALAKESEILIFDDSFSALDFKTAAKLKSSLKEKTKDKNVLLIAQRVTTVMDADRIIVLDNGHIVGMGTHKELLGKNKVYGEIVSSQLSEEELI